MLEGGRILAEQTGSYETWYFYDESGVYGMRYAGADYIFEKNIFGDIVAIYNMGTGALVGEYTYDAWGNILSQTNNTVTNANPFRYRGYYYDTETSMYYLNSRYYDPQICRFINADEPAMLLNSASTVGGANLYSYCNNNPIMYTDGTGQWFLIDDLIAAGVGAIAGLVGTLVGDITASLFTGQWQFSSWETYLGAAVGGAVGGTLSLYMPVNFAIGIGMGIGTFCGMGLENLTGRSNYSWGEILGMTALSAGIGFATAGLGKFARIQNITKGSHSFQQVWNTASTKVRNGTIKSVFNLSAKTIGKGFVSKLNSGFTVGWLASNTILGGVNALKFNFNKKSAYSLLF